MTFMTIIPALIVVAGIGCFIMIGLVAWVNNLIEQGRHNER